MLEERFEHRKIIKVTCSRHPWMKAWIVVAEHPYYAVTDDTRAFALANVPPGSYQLRVWHETLGEEEEDVLVNAGTEMKVVFELTK